MNNTDILKKIIATGVDETHAEELVEVFKKASSNEPVSKMEALEIKNTLSDIKVELANIRTELVSIKSDISHSKLALTAKKIVCWGMCTIVLFAIIAYYIFRNM